MSSNDTPTPTLNLDFYESFNARALSPRQIARGFVPPEYFSTLTKSFHSIVVGPRGSGKTTLLKMLQQNALEYWEHEQADAVRQRVDYSGVFVPTDVNLKSQLDSLSSYGFSDLHCRLVTQSAFVTHVQRGLVLAMAQRVQKEAAPFPHRRIDMSSRDEAKVVIEIASGWQVQPQLPTFSALRRSLSHRLQQIKELASREVVLGSKGRPERLADARYLAIPLLDSVVHAIDVFNDAANETDAKWALLCDELELAPIWLREELFQSLRSVDSRVLFKLSLSPFDTQIALSSITAPMDQNDYDAIPLWYARKEQGYDFCRALWAKMVRARLPETTEPESLLGPSLFEESKHRSKEISYGAESEQVKRFRRLALKDKSFSHYLHERNIDIDDLTQFDEPTRASEIRKIAGVVAIREAFRGDDDAHSEAKPSRLRSRKNPGVYSGADAFFSMVEGNPRWLIAIGNRMLDRIDDGVVIPAKVQNEELTRAAQRFEALLKTIPCPIPAGMSGKRGGVLALIDLVGGYIFRSVVTEPFNPEPVGSFRVDEAVDNELLEGLGKALNTGAIILVPERQDDVIVRDLHARRFRLSYLLSSTYKIPVRLGREISLSRIIERSSEAGREIGPWLFAIADEDGGSEGE